MVIKTMRYNNNLVYTKLRQLSRGNYKLSCSRPLTEVKKLIKLIKGYDPRKEENIFLRSEVLKTLKRWKGDLILGGCAK